MDRIQNYIDSARRKNSSKVLNWTGSPLMRNNQRNFVAQPGQMFNAAGGTPAGPSNPAMKSLPYSIQISSASGASVTNFQVLNSNTFLSNPNYSFNSAGSLVIGSIVISSLTPNVTYQQLLYQILTQPFTVGGTYISCASPSSQVLQPFTVQSNDANGKFIGFTVSPVVSPFQQQLSIITDDTPYRIDQFTGITFSQILPNAVILLRWYASDNLNTGRTLAGQGAVAAFGDPNIASAGVVAVNS